MRWLRYASVVALLALSVGCSESSGPSNEEVLESTGLTVGEASRIVGENLSAVYSGPQRVDVTKVEKSGCQTDSSSWKSVGPPWYISMNRVISDPSPDLITQTQDKLAAFVERGFEPEPGSPSSEPADRSYIDTRGFRIGAMVDTRIDGRVEFTIFSWSPCAAE